MKVVVLGAKGMLGSDLVAACLDQGMQTIGYDLDELDITDFHAVRKRLPLADWVINCAAYTRVDEAETNRDAAYDINAEGARHVARTCAKKRMKTVYISTDYVFDGNRRRPYLEQDQTNPLNVYGASKLAGEKAVRSEGGEYLLVRTQSLFGAKGRNFVRAIIEKLERSDEPLRVVEDQVTAPTYTRHLADAILRLLRVQASGIVHVTASQECTWHQFAQAIAERVKPGASILPVGSAELNLPAARPPYAVLDNRRYRLLTGHRMPTWAEGLDAYLREVRG